MKIRKTLCAAAALMLTLGACSSDDGANDPTTDPTTVVANDGGTEPSESDTAESDPATTEPATTEPAETDPATTEPAETDEATTQPADPNGVLSQEEWKASFTGAMWDYFSQNADASGMSEEEFNMISSQFDEVFGCVADEAYPKVSDEVKAMDFQNDPSSLENLSDEDNAIFEAAIKKCEPNL